MDVVADGSTLLISGQLDVRSIAELRARLYDHLSEHEEAVVLDLSGVESADLPALRMLAVASRVANRSGHRLSVRGCPDGVRRLLHLSHLRGLMIVEPEDGSVTA
jgi:anti-anti-sigma factor